jgi:hypothetical protein
MKLLGFTDIKGSDVFIVANKITGFVDCEVTCGRRGNTFIATGAQGSGGGQNGWYVTERFERVEKIITEA